MLKTLITATVLLPRLAIAQQPQQVLQPKQLGQWCPVGWMASGSYCVPGSDKAPAAIPKNVGVRPAGGRAAVITSGDGLQLGAFEHHRHLQVISKPPERPSPSRVTSSPPID
jgi:hypothetical protein